MKFREVVISFWYKELEYNPICKVGKLESILSNLFDSPILINEQEPFINIGVPRIVASNENYVFNMSLVNANLVINIHEFADYHEVILKINELMQFVFDALKEVYDLKIIYSSIKIDLSEKINDKHELQKKLLLSNENYEDFLLKTSIGKDNKYYINETVSITKEVKIDIKLPKKINPNGNDMMARSMTVSLMGNSGIEVKEKVLEINDRLHYNNDDNYLVGKDDVRDLLFEFREFLKKEFCE